jgi:hypothetical protein
VPAITKAPQIPGVAQALVLAAFTQICVASTPLQLNKSLGQPIVFFNTPDAAWSIVPSNSKGFALFAYRLRAIRYLQERAEPFEIAEPVVEPLTASEVAVNRFCLLTTLDEAIAFAQRCAREEPEPGPFYVIEVLRDTA